MSAHVSIDQTGTGWHVAVDAEDVVIVTDGADIHVTIGPDDDDTPTPLAVAFENSPQTTTTSA